MRKYKFVLETGYVGCAQEEIFEFPENITDEQLEEELKDWVWNIISASYMEDEE